MKRLILRRAAVADISAIWDYTAKSWGLRQAIAYDDALRAAVDGLLSGQTRSQSANEVRTGLRRALVGRHVVFFHETATTVTVVRVLHQRMEPGRRA